ncbi:MAG: DUF424 family protein [Methanosarcinales archaeon]|nr:DUF424 family protein [Methanosarcinales archaeon]
MYIKIYETEVSILVTVCDRELIGKTLRNNGMKLEIDEEFYKGELADNAQVQTALLEATTANIVGERSVDNAMKCGTIDQSCIIYIGGVPHAQMFGV